MIHTGYATHDRVYLVFGNRDEVEYLTNGDVKVVNAEKLIFHVDWSKSYFKPRGAFWFDALINRHGKILDIVTPIAVEHLKCMSRDELKRISYLDLSRVSDHEVCVNVRN